MRGVVVLVLTVMVLGCAVEATEDSQTPQAASGHPGAGVSGTVLETLDVSSYTYVRLRTAAGETWAAVPQAPLEVGAEVAIDNPQAMTDFESKTLGRSFETIYFGTLAGGGPASAAPTGGVNPHAGLGRGGLMSARDEDAAPIDVARAEGDAGRTVEEVYAQKAQLVGRAVALRGQVVKFNPGILGRNWIHLQDGTGDVPAGNHDITVTTSARVAVGDIVLVRGTLAVDRDFGAGYAYPVIVEDASLE